MFTLLILILLTSKDIVTVGINDTKTVPDGSWEVISGHDPAGGVVRVSGDGPKWEVLADPLTEIGGGKGESVVFTGEIIAMHPNSMYLSPVSECGYPAKLDVYDADQEVATQPPEQIDGESRKKRIVGGKLVQPQRHPWIVQLYLLNVSSGEHYFHCAGTLITNRTVLTAAHCLTRALPGTILTTIVVGIQDLRNVTFCQTPKPEENCSRALIREIESFEIHDGYSEGNLNNDIGLIYLRTPVHINANLLPVCLPYTNKLLELWDDLKLTGLGWGATTKYPDNYNLYSNVLKQVEIDLQPRSFCNKYHLRTYGKLTITRLCTAGNTGRATCNGDSGGAIVKAVVVPDTEEGKVERVFQFGIISGGGHPLNTCGIQGRPAVVTNVFFFMDWILNHITPGVLAYRYVKNAENSSAWVLDNVIGHTGPVLEEKNQLNQSVTDPSAYLNELSTGKFIDISAHPNTALLPSFHECGTLPVLIKDDQYSHKPEAANHLKDASDWINESLDSESEAILREKRVVGGAPVTLENYYPWMAQIYIRNAVRDEKIFHCSGTIISKRAILTTADCVTELPVPFVFDSVVVGQYNRNTTQECLNDVCFSPVQVKIFDALVHTDYEEYTRENNLALVRLKDDLNFTRMVQPICLPRREALISGLHSTRFFSAGWGRLCRNEVAGTVGMSQILLQVYVDILQRRDCDFVYSRTIDLLDRSRICGGGKPSQGECIGDVGSPLMKQLILESYHPLRNKIFQFGIVSFTDCGMQGMPTVYMNVLYYMHWILDNLVATDEF